MYIGATITLATVSIGIIIFKHIRKPTAQIEIAEQPQEKFQLGKLLPYIIVMAICLFFNSYFKTLAMNELSSVIVSPISQVGTMMLSSVVAHFIFKERLNLKGIVGMITAIAALLIINLKF